MHEMKKRTNSNITLKIMHLCLNLDLKKVIESPLSSGTF